MGSNIIELFPDRNVDMSRFRTGKFVAGLANFERIDPTKEFTDLNNSLENLSSSFDSGRDDAREERLEKTYTNFQSKYFEVYNRNASVVTYTLEHGEKINKKI